MKEWNLHVANYLAFTKSDSTLNQHLDQQRHLKNKEARKRRLKRKGETETRDETKVVLFLNHIQLVTKQIKLHDRCKGCMPSSPPK